MFGVLYAAAGAEREALERVAREFSPRVDVCSAREVAIDLSGLERLFGDAHTMAGEMRRTAADRGLRVRVATAGTRTAARLVVRHRAGITVVEPGAEASVLSPLPLAVLAALVNDPNDPNVSNVPNDPHAPNDPNDPNDVISTLRRWGLRTLGEFAALPAGEVAARLGQDGVRWQHLARGEDLRPLVPSAPGERFEQSIDLDWPIDGLEPLSFVLGRLFEPLSAHLERRDRGAAVLHVRLHLVTRAVHARALQLPAPMRDPRALRTLALLDLESHPPAAAIDRVTVAVDPTPGRVVQHSLLTRPLPTPEQLSTLTARLAALMGEGRSGAPAVVDTWRPGAWAMRPFAPRDINACQAHEPRRRGDAENRTGDPLRAAAPPRPAAVDAIAALPVVALRRFRAPIPVRVRVEDGRPVRVIVDRRGWSGGGRVAAAAGPWRTSGAWWGAEPWSRDEWDVELADGVTCRLFRQRTGTRGDADAWFIDGLVD